MSEKTARRQDVLELMSACSAFINPKTAPLCQIAASDALIFSQRVRVVHGILDGLVDRADNLGLVQKDTLKLKGIFVPVSEMSSGLRRRYTIDQQFKSVACHLRRMAKIALKAENHPKCFPATVYGSPWTPPTIVND